MKKIDIPPLLGDILLLIIAFLTAFFSKNKSIYEEAGVKLSQE